MVNNLITMIMVKKHVMTMIPEVQMAYTTDYIGAKYITLPF